MPPPAKPRKADESKLLAELRIAIGSRPDCTCLRINTGVFAVPGKPKQRVRSAPTGTSDLCIVQLRRVMRVQVFENPGTFMRHDKQGWHYYSQLIWCETKSKTGKLREEQQDFFTEMTRLGCICIAPRSVDEVLDVLGPVPMWIGEYQP